MMSDLLCLSTREERTATLGLLLPAGVKLRTPILWLILSDCMLAGGSVLVSVYTRRAAIRFGHRLPKQNMAAEEAPAVPQQPAPQYTAWLFPQRPTVPLTIAHEFSGGVPGPRTDHEAARAVHRACGTHALPIHRPAAAGTPGGAKCPHGNFLKGVKWSPDGCCFLTASDDGW